jgi:hypothetical protein
MRKQALSLASAAAVVCASFIGAVPAGAQNQPAQARPVAQSQVFNLTPYGVTIQPDPRIIVMMAALEAAGFDAAPGKEPSAFRQQVRKDLEGLDPDLRGRMHDFFEHNRLRATADHKPTPAEDAARYVSLALALGPMPQLDSPSRADDLPSALLEVLDFAPMVREFYRQARFNERLPAYTKLYQAEGDNMRRPAQELITAVLSYLHTQPITKRLERVETTAPTSGKKKPTQKMYTTREHERTFYIVPDLLAVPGSINFRGIGDDYYVILPFETDPRSSEVRRAYLQYVIEPLAVKYNREIAERRDQIKSLIEARTKAGAEVSPDIFLAVSRSLVAAADARMDQVTRLNLLNIAVHNGLAQAKDEASRTKILKEQETVKRAIEDETVAQLADAYERGAVLDFFFADQLKGSENSGFDVTTSLPDMIASFDPAKEAGRLQENAEARNRAITARRARQEALAKAGAESGSVPAERVALLKSLGEVEELLRVKNYQEAENRLRPLMVKYQQEPRIFFALGQAASLSAQDAFDESLQAERLDRALVNYRNAIQWASPDTDKGLIQRAHAAMGRILAFQDKPQEAAKEFDAATALGRVPGGAYDEAITGKNALGQPKP